MPSHASPKQLSHSLDPHPVGLDIIFIRLTLPTVSCHRLTDTPATLIMSLSGSVVGSGCRQTLIPVLCESDISSYNTSAPGLLSIVKHHHRPNFLISASVPALW